MKSQSNNGRSSEFGFEKPENPIPNQVLCFYSTLTKRCPNSSICHSCPSLVVDPLLQKILVINKKNEKDLFELFNLYKNAKINLQSYFQSALF